MMFKVILARIWGGGVVNGRHDDKEIEGGQNRISSVVLAGILRAQ